MLETVHYFGILHGMKRKEVKARGRFLLDLLELPSSGSDFIEPPLLGFCWGS